MDIQSFLDGMLAGLRHSRTQTQMTLGGLISRLEQLDQTAEMDGIRDAHSYRGYYSDLAFSVGSKRKVADVLADVRAAVESTFEGYKGGEFTMYEDAPVWIASYGCCGTRLMSINDDGSIVTAYEEE